MLTGNPEATAPVSTTLLYSGEQFDVDIQQQYLRARWYDQNNGRFNRLDPFFGNNEDPQSLHKYAYVHGNPVNSIDPNGLSPLAISLNSLAVRKSVSAISLAAVRKVFKSAVFTLAAITVGTQAIDAISEAITLVQNSSDLIHAYQQAFQILKDHFRNFRDSKEFRRPGKHRVEWQWPSGFEHNKPHKQLTSTRIVRIGQQTIIWSNFIGGRAGRVFEFVYKIGQKANLGSGRFLFRFDYLSFRPADGAPPPVHNLHYHLKYGGINLNHVPLL